MVHSPYLLQGLARGKNMSNFAGRPLRAIHSSWQSVNIATLVMRAALGVGFVAHGGQKLFGWFGGGGIAGTTAFFRTVGIPSPHAFAYVAGLAEFGGGIAIALGFLTVVAAIGLLAEMLIAITTVSYSAGFFVTAQKIGWELNVYLIGLLAALLFTGPGAWSADAALGLTRREPVAPALHARQAG
jgi:putative oxidoreductase